MPKAERRTSGARAAPYPAIRPGDKPRSTDSTTKPASRVANKTASPKPKSEPTANKALADKSPTAVNSAPPKTKAKSRTKKESPEDKPTEVLNDVSDAPSAKKPSPKSAPKKAALKKSVDANLEAARGNASHFLEIRLPGEDTSSVPMHDTCATVRHKINDLLGKDNGKEENGNPTDLKKDGSKKPFTKASFSRAIDCSTRSLDTFLKAKKLMGGAESPVYPAAYIFFEKKRIWEGKKKTAGRLKVEADRPNGLAFRDPNHMRVWCKAGENPADFLDEYGQ